MVKRFLSPANLIFLLLIATVLYVPARRIEGAGTHVLRLALTMEAFYVLVLVAVKDRRRVQTAGDVTAILYAALFAWDIATTRLNLLNPMLFPTPKAVMTLMGLDLGELSKGLVSSVRLLLAGYLAAVATAVPLALVIGWRGRLYRAVTPVTRVLGPIPPIVYIPYAIAILPTFTMSSMFIIFIGAFWPIFINTLNGVFTVDRRIVDSARALNVGEGTMLFKVILPAALPSVIAGANIGLVLSFILLTAAEMIGATSGLGWYVKYFSDFADYGRVIVGIIFIGFVVTAITFCVDRLEKWLLRWRG